MNTLEYHGILTLVINELFTLLNRLTKSTNENKTKPSGTHPQRSCTSVRPLGHEGHYTQEYSRVFSSKKL